ncbi:hypothetical protein [Actinomadura sp. 9N407]|uniref:hypothetical protein n=1 Tax=Actinomadura sp. 9N407 TaxID=3375154 RepID=UPI003797EE47
MDLNQVCTLPPAERPPRLAEFGALLAEADVSRPSPTLLRLVIDPTRASHVAELMVLETGCCSFFTFTLTATAGGLTLEISVPDRYRDALNAVAGPDALS